MAADLAGYAIRRRVNVWMLVLVCLLGGAIAFSDISRLEDPEFDIKEAVVVTTYPGASALEVEQQVTEPLESAIQQLAQLDQVRSRSEPGYSEIRVEILDTYRGHELPQIWDELRRKVRDAEDTLPVGAGPPQVNDDFGDVYGIYYALTGDELSMVELRETAKMLRRGLMQVDGVSRVEISGVIPDEIVIELDEARMVALNIAPDEISQALADADRSMDAGGFRAGDRFVRIAPTGEFDSVDTLRALTVGQGATRVRLGDIAEVRRDSAERPTRFVRSDGKRAVTVGVSGLSGQNIVEVGDAVEAMLARLEPDMPLGAELTPIYEQHNVVREAINSFALSALISATIVIGTFCLSMGLRAGSIIGAILVLTVGVTVLVMYLLGIELERVSLGALVIAMGLMVDNSVVLCDAMQVALQRGRSRLQAAREAVDRTKWALLGATVIGILAFSGIGLSQDTTGEFLFSLFVAIAVALLASWFLAVLLVPMFGWYLFKPKQGVEDDGEAGDGSGDGDASSGHDAEPTIQRDEKGRDAAYAGRNYDRFRGFVGGALRRRGWVAAGLAALTVACALGFTLLPQQFFPASTTPLFFVDMHLPQGTDIRSTHATALQLEERIAQLDGVTQVNTFVGSGASRFMLTYPSEQPDPSFAHVLARVDDYRIIEDLVATLNRDLPGEFADAQMHAVQLQFGPNTGASLEVRLFGDSIPTLRALSEDLRGTLEEEFELLNVRDDWRNAAPVLRPVLDRERLSDHGLTREAVAGALAFATEGQVLAQLREDDELVPIRLRAHPEERGRAEDLIDRHVYSPLLDRFVPLGQVVERVEPAFEDAVIHRRDRVRTMSVAAEPRIGESTNQAQARIQDTVEAMRLPPGYDWEWGGEHETSGDASGALISTLLLPYSLMIGITVLMFAAVRQSLVIWAMVPMSICGVTIALLLTGQPFGFLSLLGLLSLTGMLVKNGIVLVEEIDRQLASDIDPATGIVEASTSRLRPVLLTSGTTVLGMIPLLFDPFFVDMAITIMGGLAFGTVLTLVGVPCLYALFCKVDLRRCERA